MFIPSAATFNSRASALVRSPMAVIRSESDNNLERNRGFEKSERSLIAIYLCVDAIRNSRNGIRVSEVEVSQNR